MTEKTSGSSAFRRISSSVSILAMTSRAALGRAAQGGHTAAPIAKDFMKLALADKPATPFKIPPGIRLVRIDAKSGMRPAPGEGGRTILEAFKPGTAPPENYSAVGVADAGWTRAAGIPAEAAASRERPTPAISCGPEPAGFTSAIALCGVRRYIRSHINPVAVPTADRRDHARRSRTPRRRDQAVSRAAEEASLTSRHPRLASPS